MYDQCAVVDKCTFVQALLLQLFAVWRLLPCSLLDNVPGIVASRCLCRVGHSAASLELVTVVSPLLCWAFVCFCRAVGSPRAWACFRLPHSDISPSALRVRQSAISDARRPYFVTKNFLLSYDNGHAPLFVLVVVRGAGGCVSCFLSKE